MTKGYPGQQNGSFWDYIDQLIYSKMVISAATQSLSIPQTLDRHFISKTSILYHFTACTLLYILFLFPSVIPLESDNNPFASSFFWEENWSQLVSTLSTPLTMHHRSWGGDPRLRCWGCFVFLPHSQCRHCQSKLRELVLMKGGIEVCTGTANKRWHLTTALTRS